VRNAYEHIDTELEAWWNASADKKRADYNIYPMTALRGMVGGDPQNCLRNYDPNTSALTFKGWSFEILPVEKAIRELKDRIATLLPAS
jgi:hypothetical protein